MTVGELIAELESYPEDANVRIMTQPSYPFEHHIDMVVQRVDFADADEEDGDEDDVFILEGDQIGYGSKRAWG
jgi:hypothetical protein